MNYKHFNRYILVLFWLACTSASFSVSANSIHTQEALSTHDESPIIVAVVPSFFPPFYYTNNEGRPYGMAIEVLNEIDHHAGYSAKYIVKDSWHEVFKAIELNEAQVIPSLGITDQRKKDFFFTKPYAKTNITVFTRPDNAISDEALLTNLHIGVVKNNVGKKISEQKRLNNIHIYDSIKLAFDALINRKIDAIIYPQLITKNAASKLNISHKIFDTNITLKTIDRALAVSKKYPVLFKDINSALNIYMETEEFHDTYVNWYDEEKSILSRTELVFLNVFVLCIVVIIFNIVWRKKKLTILNNNSKDKNTLWVVTLILILITATTLIAASTLWILYQTALHEQKHKLIDRVKSRARLLEAVARYDLAEAKKHGHPHPKTDASERTLSQIIDSYNNFHGFGKSGEFTLARKINNEIHFVLRQRHSSYDVPPSLSFSSDLATPMRLALLGHTGAITGKDYRGEEVLAAYEPVSVLNMGLVAKMDTREIREPYIRAALYISAIVIIVSFFGSLLFFYIMSPLVKKIRSTVQRFRQLFLNNYTPALLLCPETAKILEANNAALQYYGYTFEDMKNLKLNALSPNSGLDILQALKEAITSKHKLINTQQKLKNGDIKDVRLLMSPVKFDEQTVIYCIIVDITKKLKKENEYHQLQKDLEQARKMEALGQLTGGIAHDFNNILGIIMGYTELSQEKFANGDKKNKLPEYLDNIKTASLRAKDLISSMMLFSRTDEGEHKALNIAPLVKEDIKMLRSIIPTSINIESHINENLPKILMEPVKLQQLLMNLYVNARDAIEDHGTITINLDMQKNVNSNCDISYEEIKGDWVELSITDTGSGMTEDVARRIFEPFFTTKEQGKGTGMGMAVVHGIVQDLKGHILIETEQGKGTSFKILFRPVYEKQLDTLQNKEETLTEDEKYSAKILVVDDGRSIADMLGEMLGDYGFQCTCLFSSEDALTQFNQSPEQFDLIISDQTMPNLTGLEMIQKIRTIRPDIPAIIATGYSDSINNATAKENNIVLLKKTLEKAQLITAIKNILDAI